MTSNLAKKILSIEDDAFLSSLVSVKLIEAGFTVITAATGADGITKAKAELPDLILLDLMLPDMGGLEILKLVKEDPALKNTLVIILSNMGGREEIEEGMKLGATSYLVKANILPHEVVEMVEAQLTQQKKG